MSITQHEQDGVLYYASSLLAEAGGVAHGFSTRVGGVSEGYFSSLNLGHTRGDDPERVLENYRRFCAVTGTDVTRLVFSKQVHKDNVRTVTGADIGKGLYRPRGYETDAHVTDIPGIPLVIFSADCIPVLLYDPVRRVIGAAHCGWRGTALSLAGKTVTAMCARYGCDPAHILAAIGPGISSCCFETHRDVPDAMLERYGDAALPYIREKGDGKYFVDCKGINALSLRNAGVPAEQIEISDACTCCHPELFWSHRITGQNRGSLAAVIQMTEK